MEKIIFLDIDGVISTADTDFELNDKKQDLLGKLLHETGAKIVISSSWRHSSVEETIDYMNKKGFRFCSEIVGVTIRAYHYITGIKLTIPRGVEIKHYIDTHLVYPWRAYPEKDEQYRIYEDGVFKKMKSNELGIDYIYVILDDDSDMLLEHKDYFIKTDWYDGVDEQDILRAIDILNKFNK